MLGQAHNIPTRFTMKRIKSQDLLGARNLHSTRFPMYHIAFYASPGTRQLSIYEPAYSTSLLVACSVSLARIVPDLYSSSLISWTFSWACSAS